MKLLATAEELVRHECAVLGAVTRAANNHVVQTVGEDGQHRTQTLRDSTGVRRVGAGVRRARSQPSREMPAAVASATSPEEALASGVRGYLPTEPAARHERVLRRASVRRAVTAAKRAAEEEQLESLCVARAAALRPRSGPLASERFAALKARVRAREAASAGMAATAPNSMLL